MQYTPESVFWKIVANLKNTQITTFFPDWSDENQAGGAPLYVIGREIKC